MSATRRFIETQKTVIRGTVVKVEILQRPAPRYRKQDYVYYWIGEVLTPDGETEFWSTMRTQQEPSSSVRSAKQWMTSMKLKGFHRVHGMRRVRRFSEAGVVVKTLTPAPGP